MGGIEEGKTVMRIYYVKKIYFQQNEKEKNGTKASIWKVLTGDLDANILKDVFWYFNKLIWYRILLIQDESFLTPPFPLGVNQLMLYL